MVVQGLDAVSGVHVNLASALKAREAAAGLQEDVGAVVQARQQEPRMRVVLAVVNPEVVLDVIGEVAKRRGGNSGQRVQNGLQAVVVVVAAHHDVLVVQHSRVKGVLVAAHLNANHGQRLLQTPNARRRHRH